MKAAGSWGKTLTMRYPWVGGGPLAEGGAWRCVFASGAGERPVWAAGRPVRIGARACACFLFSAVPPGGVSAE